LIDTLFIIPYKLNEKIPKDNERTRKELEIKLNDNYDVKYHILSVLCTAKKSDFSQEIIIAWHFW
jgi:hypothetical protein